MSQEILAKTAIAKFHNIAGTRKSPAMPGVLSNILFPPKRLNRRKLSDKVNGKTILITGASFGIGESLAYILGTAGARLILVARTKDKLIAVKTTIETRGGSAVIFPADLSKPEDIKALSSFILSLPYETDIVISNAGKSIMRSIRDSLDRYHDFSRTMGVNYSGPVQLLLSLIPMLEKTKGHIISVSAINVLLAPAPYWAAYQASKAAFDNWFRCAAPELNMMGVDTTSVYLPLVRTRMIAPNAAYDNMPAMSAEDAAKIICRCIIDKRKKFTPWWLGVPQLFSVLFRGLWEALTVFYLKSKHKAT